MDAPGPLITGDESPAATGLLEVKKEPEPNEEPLVLPDVQQFVPAVVDLPLVEQDGRKAAVKDVMLEAVSKSTARNLTTRVDLRDVSLSTIIGKPPRFPILHRHPARPVERKILDSVSFSLLPGETTVLLGGPRSGKSSLLDVVAGRRVDGVTGDITVNGVPPGSAYQKMVSYVVQGDDHAALLTVKETLEFAAWCQMPTDDARLIERRVDAVLQLLGLKHVSDTIVGDWAHRGVSGGEKRRCTIGIEWVKGPRFFLLDEVRPTALTLIPAPPHNCVAHHRPRLWRSNERRSLSARHLRDRHTGPMRLAATLVGAALHVRQNDHDC